MTTKKRSGVEDRAADYHAQIEKRFNKIDKSILELVQLIENGIESGLPVGIVEQSLAAHQRLSNAEIHLLEAAYPLGILEERRNSIIPF